METTPAHQNIFNAITDGTRNMIISAVAGSGKTTTIVRALGLLEGKRVLFLAFNKRIVEELTKRVPAHVEVCTLNALGHRAFKKYMANRGVIVRLDGDKVRKLIKNRLTDSEFFGRGTKVAKLVSLAKSSGIIPGNERSIVADEPANWLALGHHHDLFEADDDTTAIIADARAVLRDSCEMMDVIDFDDQLLLTHAVGARLDTYDWTFVDEAQDLSPLQHELVARCLGETGRVCAVGDPHQAIYGFRGADNASMANLAKRFDCIELPLHVSYRCPRKVVAAAQTYVGHIQPHASAPEGHVDLVPVHLPKLNPIPGDMIVCRITAPVVQAAYACLRGGTPAIVLGRDIGAGLQSLIKKLKAMDLADLTNKLQNWEDREIKKANDNEAKQATISDKASSLRVFIEAASDLADLNNKIEGMFAESTDPSKVVTCCTVHKSKGLEAHRVIILAPEKMPGKWAKQDWQKAQEANIAYVAFTRAKATLVTAFVTGNEEVTAKPTQANAAAPAAAPAMVPVRGNTYPVKDRLKAECGARWDAANKVWMVPADMVEAAQRIVGGRTATPPLPAHRYGRRTRGFGNGWEE